VNAVASPNASAITPALKQDFPFPGEKARAHALMPPGLSREKAIEWLNKYCKNKEDPISLEDYADMPLRDLRTLVRLGSEFCYTQQALHDLIKTSVERDVPVKDVLNPSYRLNARDFGAIQTRGQARRKTYKLPSRETEIPAAHYKLYIGVMGEPDFKYVFLFDERKTEKLPDGQFDYGQAIPEGGWMGYLPVKGTAGLEKLIRKAYMVGRLFNKATRPFGCCRVHIKKSKEYWNEDTDSKIKKMEEELQGIL
jgi:hypothetical protein